MLAELGEGEFFGEAALLGEHVRNATITAMRATTLLRLARHDVLALAESHPEIERRLREVDAARRGQIPHRRIGRRLLFERGSIVDWLRNTSVTDLSPLAVIEFSQVIDIDQDHGDRTRHGGGVQFSRGGPIEPMPRHRTTRIGPSAPRVPSSLGSRE